MGGPLLKTNSPLLLSRYGPSVLPGTVQKIFFLKKAYKQLHCPILDVLQELVIMLQIMLAGMLCVIRLLLAAGVPHVIFPGSSVILPESLGCRCNAVSNPRDVPSGAILRDCRA